MITVYRPTLWMLIGLPGSGKSTWINTAFQHPVQVLSTDDYIEQYAAMRGNTYSDVFSEAIGPAGEQLDANLREAVDRGMDIVWDQTNLGAGARRKKLRRIPDHYYKVAMVFPTPDDAEHQRRLDSRPGKIIPPSVIHQMKKDFVFPTLDEGFNEILVHSCDDMFQNAEYLPKEAA